VFEFVFVFSPPGFFSSSLFLAQNTAQIQTNHHRQQFNFCFSSNDEIKMK